MGSDTEKPATSAAEAEQAVLESEEVRKWLPSSGGFRPPYERDEMGQPRGISGHDLRSRLAYALDATPKEGKDDMREVVHLYTDAVGRLVIGGSDGAREHAGYVVLPEGMRIPRMTVTAASARSVLAWVTAAVKGEGMAAVHPQSELLWRLSYGGAEDMTLEWKRAATAPEEWTPRTFATGPGAGAAMAHDAKHVSRALAMPAAKGSRIGRDEVDSAGYRHVTVTDPYGIELGRAVLAPLGHHEDKKADPRQIVVPGALPKPGARDVARAIIVGAPSAAKLSDAWAAVEANTGLSQSDRDYLAGVWLERAHGLGVKWAAVRELRARPTCDASDFPEKTSGYAKKTAKKKPAGKKRR